MGGGIATPEALSEAFDTLKKDEKGFIHVSRVAQCIDTFRSYKLIVGANRSLDNIIQLIRKHRKIKDKLVCEICTWYGNKNPKLTNAAGRFCEEHAQTPMTLV